MVFKESDVLSHAEVNTVAAFGNAYYRSEISITGSITSGNSGTTVYTVPANKILIVTDMSLYVYVNNNSVQGTSGIQINQGSIGSSYLIKIDAFTSATEFYKSNYANMSLAFPMRLNEADTVYIDKTTNDTQVIYFVHGYLIDAS